ncbi:MAG: long-chain fatty acid transporter [Bacteroidetes bacterium RIFCSPHIGHO2_02_FULL_44_7]|nr:MAG: long-chain fatty acid transporter [Bacteroidetes bacterium RIFCSPHIGHO2_02_FULL_44_7]
MGLLCLPHLLFSQGFQVNLQGQTQQGMASAGTAFMHDASSLFFNPGGACFVDHNDIQIGSTFVIPKGTFLDANSDRLAHTNSPMSTPFGAYGLFQLKDSSRLKLGIAAYTPFGSTVEWEDGWSGRFALTRLQLLSIFVQPTVSYRISDKVGLGAGFVYSYGKVNLQKDLPIMDQNGEFGHVELNGKGQGFGFNAGLYLDLSKFIKIGLTYRSAVRMKLKKGTATFDVPASLADKFPSGEFSGSLPLPQVITLGLASNPTEKLVLALDVNFVGWKIYDTLAFDYSTNTESLQDTKSARLYENIFAFRLGAQYEVAKKMYVRAGIGYGITPVQTGYVTPETPDGNRINYTVGIGYTIGKHLTLDASFLYTEVERTDTNIETQLSGTYKTRVFAPGISISYQF